jgi:copper amine oxidase-like protein
MNRIARTLGLGLALATAAFATAQDHRHREHWVFIDGHHVDFKPTERPYWSQGTLLVPFRALAAKLGAVTGRNQDGLRVWIDYGRQHVEFKQGHNDYWLNGRLIPLPTSSEGPNNVLFIPVTIFINMTHGRVSYERGFDR